jgi:hypothetical protein
MIQLVTDSASMLPDEVRRRFGIDVVALTITIDGEDFAEGVDLTTASSSTPIELPSGVVPRRCCRCTPERRTRRRWRQRPSQPRWSTCR